MILTCIITMAQVLVNRTPRRTAKPGFPYARAGCEYDKISDGELKPFAGKIDVS